MSVTLLLDSSDKNLSVGLSKDGEMVDGLILPAWQRQSELLVPEIKKILDKHHFSRSDLDAVVVTKGPGSYTGVRIALTAAKTISFALSIPLYLVSSLAVLRSGDKPTICLSNARSLRSYIGVYQGTNCLLSDTVMSNDEVKDYIAKHPDEAVAGDLSYLQMDSAPFDLLSNLAQCAIPVYLCAEPLAARPVYLKDTYEPHP